MKNNVKETVIELLIKHINEELSQEDIIVCDNLEEIGMNSLNFIQLIIDLEEVFDVEFDEMSTVSGFETLDKIARYIEENM